MNTDIYIPLYEPCLYPHYAKIRECVKLKRDLLVDTRFGEVFIPDGFESDGASIPSFAWALVGSPFDPRIIRAAFAHDWGYHTHQYTQAQCDQYFLDILREDGHNMTQSEIMYWTLRCFGFMHWENDKDDQDFMAYNIYMIKQRGCDPKDYGINAD